MTKASEGWTHRLFSLHQQSICVKACNPVWTQKVPWTRIKMSYWIRVEMTNLFVYQISCKRCMYLKTELLFFWLSITLLQPDDFLPYFDFRPLHYLPDSSIFVHLMSLQLVVLLPQSKTNDTSLLFFVKPSPAWTDHSRHSSSLLPRCFFFAFSKVPPWCGRGSCNKTTGILA